MKLLSVLLFCFLLINNSSGELSDVEKLLLEKTELVSDDFSKEESIKSAPWTLNHGKWRIENETLIGEVIPEENHGANISAAAKFSENYFYTFDFKLVKGGMMTMGLLGGGGGKGVCVVLSEKDIFFRVKGGSGIIGWQVADIPAKKWHTLQVLVVKDKILACVKGIAEAQGQHEKVAVKKSRLSIGTDIGQNSVDNVKLYNVKVDQSSIQKKFQNLKSYTMKEFHQLRQVKVGLDGRGRPAKENK